MGSAHLLLLFNDDRELCVWDLRIQLTSHQSGTFIILDVSDIFGFRNFDFFGETLQGKSIQLSGSCATKLFSWLLSAGSGPRTKMHSSQYHCYEQQPQRVTHDKQNDQKSNRANRKQI